MRPSGGLKAESTAELERGAASLPEQQSYDDGRTLGDYSGKGSSRGAADRQLGTAAAGDPVRLRGTGGATKDSDVDILVVIEDETVSPRQESVRIRRELADISMPMDILVVSERRLAELVHAPGLIYREALRHGMVVYESPSRRSVPGVPSEWLTHAQSDLNLARLGRGRDDILPAQICFHAQQAAEKALKAVLLAATLGFPLSHDIQELLTIANQGGLAVPSEVAEAVVLTPFAVEARYPGYAEEITLVEVDAAIRTAEVVVGWATTMVTGVDVETSAED